jgi:hypothetical protein
VVRPRVIDVVTDGHLTSRVGRGAGPISMQTLAAYLPPGGPHRGRHPGPRCCEPAALRWT